MKNWRTVSGLGLIVVPFIGHAILESTGKGWLGMVPEPVIDTLIGAAMVSGLVIIVSPTLLAQTRRRR